MIKYKKRRKYKYNLRSDFIYSTGIKVDTPKDLGYLKIDSDGELLIKAGYSWDGPSGPAIDTKNFMQGSLVHDALYQLLRECVIEKSYRKRADEILRTICKKDGMLKIRACWVYLGVRIGGACSAKPDMLEAP
ncbi:MAG: DUF1353 domain-containing protein [Spirochaetales bacterium]|nr:DUF1353 domain-containing protein [Spirochaetales bacterium]